MCNYDDKSQTIRVISRHHLFPRQAQVGVWTVAELEDIVILCDLHGEDIIEVEALSGEL